MRTNLGYGIGYGDTDELPFFNNFFAGGLSAAGVLRGFEENSLGPESTPGARYLTQRGISLLKDDEGNIIKREDGSAAGLSNEFGYSTAPVFDANGNRLFDENGNPEVALAVENFFLDEDFDSSSCSERRRLLKNCSDFDLAEIRYSVGVSVTYLSPFGPLTFYLAQPFGKDGDDTRTFDFTVGQGF